jgi:acetyltransferase-like isoleucine patch superfamily enzyme
MNLREFDTYKPPNIEDGKLTKWNWMVNHKDNLKIGKNVDIGAFCYIDAKEGIILEDYVQIGSHTSIYSSTTIDNKKGKVHLKRNARVGSHCVIMPNVTIGENSILGALSFANKDIPDNEVWVGSPAKFLRKNNSEDKCQ